MKTIISLVSFLSFVAFPSANSYCQSAGNNALTLQLISSISLSGVNGRIDHMAFDNKRQFIYVAAPGNNTVEVVDLKSKKVIHSIKGLHEPLFLFPN